MKLPRRTAQHYPATPTTILYPASFVKPTGRQRTILAALASRPSAYITASKEGYVVTDGHGWLDERASRLVWSDELNALGRHGWLMERHHTHNGRVEFVLTAAGRELVTGEARS